MMHSGRDWKYAVKALAVFFFMVGILVGGALMLYFR